MRRGAFVGLWLFGCCLALAAVWIAERRARLAELTTESARLHTAMSQRVDQHDAHLTALSAIAVAGADARPDLFREVSGAVMQFYPRITQILLVPLVGAPGGSDARPGGADLEAAVRDAAAHASGTTVLLTHPAAPKAFIVVKRSPNTQAARYRLALVIDAAALMAAESDFWSRPDTARALAMPDGTTLIAEGAGGAPPQFGEPLASTTQALRLETAIALTPAALLPPRKAMLALMLATLIAFALRAALHQRARVRAAERSAELSGMETRLSHAARVNALGEMASGMAHELTQPLTAILARSQAARHLAARGETAKLAESLDEVVGQTRRASAILERLRTWTRPQDRRTEPVDLRDCIGVADSLLAQPAQHAGTALDIRMPATAVTVLADRIELEQVLFNLVKNALDAVAGSDGTREVQVTLTAENGTARIDVSDTGPGVRDDIREELFTPFVTTRENGTGLGLVLSHRLVERAGGELTYHHRPKGALFRLSLPLAAARREATE